MDKFQKIGVTGFIYKDGEVLVLKRSQKESFLPGNWEMPGGKVEFGESPEDAVVREMMEEAGLEVEAIKPYNLFSYVSQDGQRHTVDIQYLVEVVGNVDQVKLSDAHEEYKWITLEKIKDNFNISDMMGEAVKKGFGEIK